LLDPNKFASNVVVFNFISKLSDKLASIDEYDEFVIK